MNFVLQYWQRCSLCFRFSTTHYHHPLSQDKLASKQATHVESLRSRNGHLILHLRSQKGVRQAHQRAVVQIIDFIGMYVCTSFPLSSPLSSAALHNKGSIYPPLPISPSSLFLWCVCVCSFGNEPPSSNSLDARKVRRTMRRERERAATGKWRK